MNKLDIMKQAEFVFGLCDDFRKRYPSVAEAERLVKETERRLAEYDRYQQVLSQKQVTTTTIDL